MDDRNRFNLKLSSLSLKEGVHRNPSITSQTQNEDEANELVNILPSYQMFRSTITKNLTPSVEDSRTAPPQYEMTPDLSTVRLHEYFASVPTSPSPNFEEQQQRQLGMGMSTPGDDQEGEEGDEVTDETILENAHKLKRLTSFNKDIAKQLEVKINITKHFGKLGEPYTLVDPLSLELKQGDYIYGFVLITNKTKHPIPFDMFSVQLEGCATFGKTTNSTLVEQPTHIDRFLTMFDFHASWNDAYLDRLISDHNDPHKPISVFDPIDNTHYHLDHRKIFEPGLTYKKYFTFKIPEKLLESVCDHSLIKHLQIPPTLGVSKNEMISSLRNKWKDQHDKTTEEGGPSSKKYKYASLTNDFSFNDTSISYCISARVIGRASGYQQFFGTLGSHTIDETNDEYVVANEDYKYLRVMPVTKTIFELNRSMIHQEARLLYTNMVDKIKEKITLGKDILAARQQQNSLQPVSSGGSLRQLANTLSPQTSLSNLGGGLRPVSSEPSLANTSTPPLTPTSSTTDLIKMQQSYYSKVNQRNIHVQNENTYEVFFPYKKKSVFGHTKIIGLTAFSTPKKEYYVHYIPLPQFQPKQKPIPTILNIPIDLTFIYGDDRHQSSSSSSSLPEFKSLSVELVSLTVKSKKLPIPIVIHPEMMFENKTKNGGNSNDNFDILTIKKFQKYAIELSRLLKEVGPEALDVERDLVQDIKCLANLSTKYVHVNIRDVGISANGQSYDSIGSVPWQKEILKSTDNNSGKVQNTSKFYKNLQLSVNFANAVLKPINSTDFCLIPDFQSCLLARIYYLKIDLKFHTSTEKVTLRVPIVLQKS